MSDKTLIATMAKEKGVTTSFSGKQKTMFVNGEDKQVKSFIRICNLKGKGYFGFAIKQG